MQACSWYVSIATVCCNIALKFINHILVAYLFEEVQKKITVTFY